MTDTSDRLQGKVALVTGAGNGIGQACALALARHGASVVVNDLGTDEFATGRNSAAADGTVTAIREAGGTAAANYDSVADPGGCAAAVQTAIDEFGKVDIVVGCAGAILDGTLAADDETYQRFMALFLHQKFWLARAALPGMLERGWGRLITTTSHGATGLLGQPTFAAAMGGVISMTRAIAFEHESAGVTANCLAPGGATRLHAVTRPMFEQLRADELITEAEWDVVREHAAARVRGPDRGVALHRCRERRDRSGVPRQRRGDRRRGTASRWSARSTGATTAPIRRGRSRSSTSWCPSRCCPNPDPRLVLSCDHYGRPVRAVVAAVLLAIAVSVCCAMLPGTHADAATATPCANGPEAGTPKPATAGITRTDYTFAHRVDGKCRTLVTQVREPSPSAADASAGDPGDPRTGRDAERARATARRVDAGGLRRRRADVPEDQEGCARQGVAQRGRRPGRRRPVRARPGPGPRVRVRHRSRRGRRRRHVARRDDGVRAHLAPMLRRRSGRARRSSWPVSTTRSRRGRTTTRTCRCCSCTATPTSGSTTAAARTRSWHPPSGSSRCTARDIHRRSRSRGSGQRDRRHDDGVVLEPLPEGRRCGRVPDRRRGEGDERQGHAATQPDRLTLRPPRPDRSS